MIPLILSSYVLIVLLVYLATAGYNRYIRYKHPRGKRSKRNDLLLNKGQSMLIAFLWPVELLAAVMAIPIIPIGYLLFFLFEKLDDLWDFIEGYN